MLPYFGLSPLWIPPGFRVLGTLVLRCPVVYIHLSATTGQHIQVTVAVVQRTDQLASATEGGDNVQVEAFIGHASAETSLEFRFQADNLTVFRTNGGVGLPLASRSPVYFTLIIPSLPPGSRMSKYWKSGSSLFHKPTFHSRRYSRWDVLQTSCSLYHLWSPEPVRSVCYGWQTG